MTRSAPIFVGVVLGLVITVGCAKRELHMDAVNVSSSAIYCIFDRSCRVTFTDRRSTPIPMQIGGTAVLESRTFAGKPGTPAAGLYGYEYRVDLEKATEITVDVEGVATRRMPCLRSMALEFGPIIETLDYNGDGKAGDLVYVITSGGPGKIGLEHAHRSSSRILLYFDSPICAGASGRHGDSTFYFGLVSARPPRSVTASIKETADLTPTSSKLTDSPHYEVPVLAPEIGAAGKP